MPSMRCLIAITILVSAGAAARVSPAAETVWDAMRVPGAVVVVRHSYAPGAFDPPDARLDDCSTQRNLDENGRAQAKRIGEAFGRNGVTVGAVLSSPRCRCLDTARLAFGRVESWDVLQGSLRDAEFRKRLVARIKERIAEHRSGPPLVVYPVYVDSNVMAGRGRAPDAQGRYAGLVYLPCKADTGFEPPLPDRHADLIYLCYPNNPTGAVMTHAALRRWVDWARRERAVILYDAAYEAYVREPGIPRTIYEIEGAREVAIELRSFSKTAGFTGQRCAFTIVPKELHGTSVTGERVALNPLWFRRQSTKFNGVPYVVQRGAAAVYSDEGARQVRQQVDFYMENARIIRE